MPTNNLVAEPVGAYPTIYEDLIATTASMLNLIVVFLFCVVLIFIFKKAGKEWWKALIPIYNTIVLLEIVRKPWWWFLLLFIPIVNFIILVMITFELSRAFGHGTGFGLGLFFLPFIFYPILAFGSSKYVYGNPPIVQNTQQPIQGTPVNPENPQIQQ